VLTKRTFDPQPAFTGSMHHWQSVLPPEPYRWVLRWHAAQRPTLSPEQTSADGSGSVIGGGEAVIVCLLFGEHPSPEVQDTTPDSTKVRAALWNSRGLLGVPVHMDSALLNTALSAAGAVLLVFLGGWENERRTLRTDARKQAEVDRAELEAQADELVTAVLAVRVVGNTHDHLWGSWRPKLSVALRAAIQGGAAYAASRQRGFPAAWIGYGEAAGVITQWDRESAASAAELTAPLNRLAAAVTPLLRRLEPGLAPAAEELLTAVVDHYTDTDRTERALAAFHQALRPALEPPAVRRRLRWALRRGRGGDSRQLETASLEQGPDTP
jgi:hypothetical protein